MKKTLLIFVIAIFLQSCQGTSTDDTVTNNQTLVEKKLKIQNYINNFPCAAASGCSSIAFGDKPCGGPREYLVFSNAVNITILQNMVQEYNMLDKENNIKTNAISDCMLVTQPANVGCVNGVCSIIN